MTTTATPTRATSALDDLYRRHVGDVYRYAYAVLGNHADAEDITQTTFVNALRALERGEQPRNPSSWLVAIAHNLVRQRWRQAASRPTEVELAHDVPDGGREDEVELEGLVRALQRIPPAQREALVMRELEGRSYREISELLSLSNSALETLLFRARRSLAEELENLVTCQSAELSISRRLDGRLGRKDRRRLATHLDECPACARLAEMQTRQRRAFKGLAVLPLPIGLALFKGAPAATASVGLPTIGGAAAGLGGAGSAGTAGTASTAGAAAIGAAGGGGGAAAVGGSVLGGAAAKVAAVVAAASVATGVGYEGVKAVRDAPPAKPAKAVTETRTRPASATGERGARRAADATPRTVTPDAPVRARGVADAPGTAKRLSPPGRRAGQTGTQGPPTVAKRTSRAKGPDRSARAATPTRRRTNKSSAGKAPRKTAREAARAERAPRSRLAGPNRVKKETATAKASAAKAGGNGSNGGDPSSARKESTKP